MLNILLIINDNFYKRSYQIFNPRNAMQISRNDGKFNNAVNHQKDTVININTMISLGRENYTPQQLEKIKRIKQKYAS